MQPRALSAFKDNYIWVIEEKNTFICVDPGDAMPVVNYAHQSGLSLAAILLTHHHDDHTHGVLALKEMFNQVTIYGPNDARLNHIAPLSPPSIMFGSYQFEVLTTPGHTKSHLCYFEPNQLWLFCGDTLFSAGCGRVFDGDVQSLYQSLMQLKQLPADTKVFCGHEYTRQNLMFAQSIEPHNQAIHHRLLQLINQPDHCSLPSTIALEREINPFFRVPSFQAFKSLREKKDQWTLN